MKLAQNHPGHQTNHTTTLVHNPWIHQPVVAMARTWRRAARDRDVEDEEMLERVEARRIMMGGERRVRAVSWRVCRMSFFDLGAEAAVADAEDDGEDACSGAVFSEEE